MIKKGILKTIQSTFSKNINFFLEMTKDYALKKVDNRYINFSKSLNVYSYNKDEKCVYLKNDSQMPMYALELASRGNQEKILKSFKSIIKNYLYTDSAKITLFYTKTKIRDEDEDDKFYTKQSTYIFSSNKQLLEDIAYSFDISLLEVDKIFQALYDIGLINEYSLDRTTLLLKSRFHFTSVPIDDINIHFKTIFAEGVYGALSKDENPMEKKYKLYQGIGLNGAYTIDKPNLYDLYDLPWNGYIAINMDFSEEVIERYFTIEDEISFSEKNKEIRRAYKGSRDNLSEIINDIALCNIVALVDNPNALTSISSLLNVSFIPKNVKQKDIIYSTPIIKRDPTYDFIAKTEEISKTIKIIHKKHNIVSRTSKNMVGVDTSGNLINYTFSETGSGLHWAIVAPTRSGKTFTILKTIQNTIGAIIVDKTEDEIEHSRQHDLIFTKQKVSHATKFDTNKIVHFDTGYSAIGFIEELKKRYPDRVYISKDDVGMLRFGLLNIPFYEETKKVKEEDLLLSTAIINLILELNKFHPINAIELGEFKKAVKTVFARDKYEGKSLMELREIGGYDEVIERIYQRAKELDVEIDELTRTTDKHLQLRGSRLDYIQKPILFDVIIELTNKKENFTVLSEETKACETLITKLKAVNELDMFAFYDKENIKNVDYYYLELQSLKELGEQFFLPAFVMTIDRLYRRDMQKAQQLKNKKLAIPDTHYIIEEAHNFTKIKVLEDYFRVIAKEGSRYGIFFGFITQEAKDIPRTILANIATRMVLSSEDVTKAELAYFWAKDEDDKEEVARLVNFYYARKKQYLNFIYSAGDILTMTNKVSRSEAELFNSNGVANGLIKEDMQLA